MTGWQFGAYGACGGALVEVLRLLHWVSQWQEARRTSTGRLKKNVPVWSTYVDWKASAVLVILRGGLGACAAALFGVTGQISGPYVAVALGFAAPSILAQLGGIPQVAAALNKSPAANSAPSDGEAGVLSASPAQGADKLRGGQDRR
ncbi:hypothetical protein [Streptomyces sp. MBT62]|uniref:hypothetical protein n=1 Tax=Streptomyces sp. MBT62 TaxID=2800410 RepID=UPI00190C9DF0|nr:hypothetical protein [Streptomyces sp. MBT62]MBK3570972.1 hypothetical protein [Streptomyces sp. MBT62]